VDLQITAFLSIVIDQLGTIFNSQAFIDNLKATAEIRYVTVFQIQVIWNWDRHFKS